MSTSTRLRRLGYIFSFAMSSVLEMEAVFLKRVVAAVIAGEFGFNFCSARVSPSVDCVSAAGPVTRFTRCAIL